MSATVFANGMSIACKVSSGKTTAAMPDVCLSPPPSPAGPIPIPYPNTSSASDTDKGSTTVSIGGEPVMLKDRSIFKTSTGNEAATKNLGMGVVTHKIQGEAAFVAWSMDVKFQGENVPRHMDLMGHNEACNPSQTPPWPFMESMAKGDDPCAADKDRESRACGGMSEAEACTDEKCQSARGCKLMPHRTNGKSNCCPPKKSHHLVEVHCFAPANKRWRRLPGFEGYRQNNSPTVCVVGERGDGQHGVMHAVQQQLEAAYGARNGLFTPPSWPAGVSKWTYAEARDAGVIAHSFCFPHCRSECIAAQLDAYHMKPPPDGPGVTEDTPVRTDPGAATQSQGEPTDEGIRRIVKAVDSVIAFSSGAPAL